MVSGNAHQLTSLSKNRIAYFSMEIGFTPEIPTYSGGLGILAGDTLKSLADIGVDVVGVTLLSEKGYFQQSLDESGWQKEDYPAWPVAEKLKKLSIKVNVMIENRMVSVSVWKYVLRGVRGKLLTVLFLDTNNPENNEEDRKLTSYLYGTGHTYRLRQEIILGIGGVKVLRELGFNPRKYHLNEGHAAFLILELYRELRSLECEGDQCHAQKQSIIRQLCSFTTHTPVAAGHDEFSLDMIHSQLGSYIPQPLLDMVAHNGKFSMTRLALHFSSYVNAVARKHQEVSKRMFPEFNIDYITNGVHSVTWINDHLAQLFDKHIIDWRVNSLELRNSHKIPRKELTAAHQKAKNDLFAFVKERTGVELDPEVFTIGFARRAAGYKRAHLLFRDIERLKQISRTVGRIQLVFAGKAHPNDDGGKHTIQHIINIAKQLAPAIQLVYIPNYNMTSGKYLTSGVDLWLNTPKRPLEASGTSGMKAAHNGVPSLSIPDGWWVEGLIEGVTGWGIGEEILTETDDEKIDAMDANEIYKKLERDIIPLFYTDKDAYAIVMRNAIAINASYFNTLRMVDQYLVRAYARNN